MSGLCFPRETDSIRLWARLTPERTALVDRAAERRFTYAALDAEADRWRALLRDAGIGRGDRVALLAGNRHEAVALFFACARVGAALVPLNWRLAASELGPILLDAAPALLVGEDRFRALAEGALGAGGDTPRWLDLDAEAPALLRNTAAHGGAADVVPAPDDPWLVLYTSGSTGRPKGAVLPHRQIFYNAVATTVGWALTQADVAPVSTPLFHTGGWNVFATPLWHVGGRVVLFDRFEPDDFLAGMAAEGCTVALTVPTQLVMLLESAAWGHPLPALRTFMSGGAPLPRGVAERVRAAGYGLREGYGLTECGPNCFASSDAHAVARPGSVGWPMPFLELRLVDEQGGDVEPGAPGELWLRGPQCFGGYLHAPERTAEALTADGWLRTGDLARRDPDGAVTICGRRKEMYISGGENVFPAEVEAALVDCPDVAEAVVVGVPDARWGEVGCAFVVPRRGVALHADAVLAHARARLAGYKVPRRVEVVEALPRLGSGKPDRRALQQQATTVTAPFGAAARDAQVLT